LLGDGENFLVRQQPPHGSDDPLSVRLSGLFRVDLQRGEPGHRVDGCHGIANGHAENLSDVGGWIGADKQHRLARMGQMEGRRARDGGLADSSLAGEE
jgi:hypothetical protein